MKSILFVCLGNICRSPLAEGIAKKLIKEKQLNIKIDSAGTGDWHIGESPCEYSIKVASLNGVDISQQKGRQVTLADFTNYDMIVALDDSNIANLKKLADVEIFKLGYFGYENADIPDPFFFEGFEGFDKVYEMIETCVIRLIDEHVDG